MRPTTVAILSIIAAAIVFAACGGDGDGGATPTPTPTSEPATPTPGPPGIADLARAVVQVHALDFLGDPVWTGSGTFVSADGLILTNAHVVDDRFDEYDFLGVAATIASDQPPDLRYEAEILAVDYVLDLAVIAVIDTLDGSPLDADFPFVEIGDSDTVEIGDELRILGYPGIGGETITLTDGVISGFTTERSISGRAWIKTDATITGGNSGGLAVDGNGRLVGVPTIVGSGADADFVDCRLLSDTNRDGVIDERDTCIPVGGFINGLRPVNLALPLISAAESGQQYVSEFDVAPAPAGGFDTSDVFIDNVIFSTGVTANDEPTEVIDQAPRGIVEICAFWDYEGMADGMTWEALWFIDGALNEGGSFLSQTWAGGQSGSWWVCIFDEVSGLADGLYEIVLLVEDEALGSNALFVGDSRPRVELSIDNLSSFDICFLYVSPTGAQNWGFDHLGAENVLLSGQSFSIFLPAGFYDILTMDCFVDEPLTVDYEIDLLEDTVYTITDA